MNHGCLLTDISTVLESVSVDTPYVSSGSPLGSEGGTPWACERHPTGWVFAEKFRLMINVAHAPYVACGNRLYIGRFYRLTSGRSTSMPHLSSGLANIVGFEYEVDLQAQESSMVVKVLTT